jgi:hypothetical protein
MLGLEQGTRGKLVRVRSTLGGALVCSFSHFRFLVIDLILPKREESRRVVQTLLSPELAGMHFVGCTIYDAGH